MLNENIKTLRKLKGLSQEEMAIRLNVVRQTVSKWERGLSVPDADMLVQIAEILEVPVSQLLGAKTQSNEDYSDIASHLSSINEHLAVKNRRARRIWKIIAIIFIAIIVINILIVVMSIVSYSSYKSSQTTQIYTEKISEP